jgi:hypothetical protein
MMRNARFHMLATLVAVLVAGACSGVERGGGPTTTAPTGTVAATTAAAVSITVPDLTGSSAEYARGALEALGLDVEITEVAAPDAIPGTVIGQIPDPDTALAPGSRVLIEIAAAENPTTTGAPATTAAPETTSTTTPPGTTSTTPPATTTATTAPPIVYAVGPPPYRIPPPLDQVIAGNGAGTAANGTGCAPPGDVLPDGVWFGVVTGISTVGESISLDLGCLYTGDDARAEAEFDGTDAPNDYYIRNVVPKIFTTPAAPAFRAVWLRTDLAFVESDFAGWAARTAAPPFMECPGVSCRVWLYVNGGRVTELLEQFLP